MSDHLNSILLSGDAQNAERCDDGDVRFELVVHRAGHTQLVIVETYGDAADLAERCIPNAGLYNAHASVKFTGRLHGADRQGHAIVRTGNLAIMDRYGDQIEAEARE